MDKRELFEFGQDVYDLMGMNTNFINQREFYEKYVRDDDAFMVSVEGNKQVIYFDKFKVTIEAI